MSPIGIVAGMVIINMSTAATLVSGILIAFSSGTFLYIASIELSEEFESRHNMMLKLAAVLIGFASMTLVAVFGD